MPASPRPAASAYGVSVAAYKYTELHTQALGASRSHIVRRLPADARARPSLIPRRPFMPPLISPSSPAALPATA